MFVFLVDIVLHKSHTTVRRDFWLLVGVAQTV